MPAGSSPQFDLSLLQPHLEQGVLLLTPNQRLGRHIKYAWDRAQIANGKLVWEPVAVRALEHWLDDCWQQQVESGQLPRRQVLSTLQEKELWRQVIEADRAAEQEYSLLQLGSAVDLAKQARDQLLRAQVDTADGTIVAEFNMDPDCSTFYRWLQNFEQRLSQGGMLTAEDRMVSLASCAASERRRRVALVDFDDIPPLHRSCLAQLAEEVIELSSTAGEAELGAYSYADRESELAAVARWAKRQHDEEPERRIGILLSDMNGDRGPLEYLLRREFDCLGERYASLPVNFSTGITLDRAPVIRDALRMLATVGRHLSMGDLLGLINSRFCRDSLRQGACTVKLLQQLYDDGTPQLDVARLRYLAREVRVGEEKGTALGENLGQCQELRLQRLRQVPSEWVDCFTRVLNIWGWPGNGPLDSLEYQQVEAWYKVLEELASQDELMGELDLSAALALLRRCCQGRISQPQTATSPIQVLGPLEAAGLQFERIWFCGLQANRWPAPVRPNPFIPMALQRRFQMPHSNSEREWNYAATLMAQYRAGCDEMTGSYARQLDGVPELPSPMLAETPVTHVEETAALPAQWIEQFAGRDLAQVEDATAPALDATELEGIRGGSGILQQQANCPFRAFASRRLGLEPLGDYRSGLSSAHRGSILHDALYALWGHIENSEQLAALSASEQCHRIEEAVAIAISNVPEHLRLQVGLHCLDLEKQRLLDLLDQWLEKERQRDGFTVIAREAPISLELEGLNLQLRVDRVDELSDGARLVIDYKSGRNSLADWMGERPTQPQLPLYGLAGDISGLAFAEVRPRDSRFLGLGETEGIAGVQTDIAKGVKRYSSSENWQSLVEEWRSNLSHLARQFLAGQAAVDPLPGACNFCAMDALCRVQLADQEALS